MSNARVAPARAAAFEILLKVASGDAHGDELLRSPVVDDLSAQDRALATTLVFGTLRWQMRLDARIRPLLTRSGAQLPPSIEATLRLGAFQLLYLDRIPPHAAISESVELAKRAGETYAAGMVNAVLRKVASMPHIQDENEAESAHPQWIVDRWAQTYGVETTRSICIFDQKPVMPCIRLMHPDAELSLVEEKIDLAPGAFLIQARRVVRGDIARSKALRNGWVHIQDEGSQLIAELAGHGSSILDTCAAPGGKTAILAERNLTARILATDVSGKRLAAVRRNLTEDRITFAVQDASTAELLPQYDLVLCDVPCTGTGTIARNPEIRFRINKQDILRQHERQVRILSRSLEGLVPGGRLLYSTCSLEPEENEAVIAECCERMRGFELVPLHEEVTRLEHAGVLHAHGADLLRTSALQNGFLRTLPGVHPCDGFYAALIIRQ